MMMEWTPGHAGRWLFHCHFQGHFSTDKRAPLFSFAGAKPAGEPGLASGPHEHHDSMTAMNDMAGPVLMINVRAQPMAPKVVPTGTPRKLDLVIEPNAADGKDTHFLLLGTRWKEDCGFRGQVGGPADRSDARRTHRDHGAEQAQCSHQHPLAAWNWTPTTMA
jgi:hypothetical protein